MRLSLKPQHLHRYRDITRLFLRYGRGDLLRDSGLDDLMIQEPAGSKARGATAAEIPRVHEKAGEILREHEDRVAGQDAKSVAAKAPVPPEQQDINARAAALADDLEAMGPTFIKLGQFLSTRPDLLPTAYLEALARLQDQIEPFPYSEVERIIAEELGTRVTKAFLSFDQQPLAAASLGQVHRAELRSGELVAVKVQRPGIREVIAQDLEILGQIAEFLDSHTEVGRRHGFVPMLDELRKSLLRELDYRQEARNLDLLADRLHHLEGIELIVVPRPAHDYVTQRVLAMQFVDGRKIGALGPLARLEINGHRLADQLMQAYLQQILVDGFFHADPHPGNVFLTRDGRLALLDLGMTAQLAPEMQEHLLKLVLAVSEGHGEDAADVMIKVATPLGDENPTAVRRQIAEIVTYFHGRRMREIALGRLLFSAARAAAEAGYRAPRELTMLSKALLNVDDVSRRIDPEFDPNAAIRRHASQIMHRRMLRAASPAKLFSGLLEAKELIENLPRRLNQLFDAIANNRLRVKVDTINEVLLMEGLQKIANRITLGLVISAMIVGAAMLMRVPTSFRILGYPGLAILFFLGAAFAGIVLVYNIFSNDIKAEKQKLKARQRQHEVEESE